MKTIKILGLTIILGTILFLLIKDTLLTQQLLNNINNQNVKPPITVPSMSTPNMVNVDSATAKLYCEVAERNFKASKGVFDSIQWTYTFTGALISLFITLFGFLGFKFILPMLLNKQIKSWAENSKEFHKIKADIQENSREMNIALAQVYRNNGLSRWKEGVPDRAIELTEQAFLFFRKACPERKPRNKDDQILWGTICGNLSYYYAENKNHAKYDDALKYAKIALTIGKKYHIMPLVENFPYVVKQYDMKNTLLREEAKEIITMYKEDLLKIPGIKAEEIKAYEDYFS